MDELTLADVNAAVKKHLQYDNLEIVFVTKDAAVAQGGAGHRRPEPDHLSDAQARVGAGRRPPDQHDAVADQGGGREDRPAGRAVREVVRISHHQTLARRASEGVPTGCPRLRFGLVLRTLEPIFPVW